MGHRAACRTLALWSVPRHDTCRQNRVTHRSCLCSELASCSSVRGPRLWLYTGTNRTALQERNMSPSSRSIHGACRRGDRTRGSIDLGELFPEIGVACVTDEDEKRRSGRLWIGHGQLFVSSPGMQRGTATLSKFSYPKPVKTRASARTPTNHPPNP